MAAPIDLRSSERDGLDACHFMNISSCRMSNLGRCRARCRGGLALANSRSAFSARRIAARVVWRAASRAWRRLTTAHEAHGPGSSKAAMRAARSRLALSNTCGLRTSNQSSRNSQASPWGVSRLMAPPPKYQFGERPWLKRLTRLKRWRGGLARLAGLAAAIAPSAFLMPRPSRAALPHNPPSLAPLLPNDRDGFGAPLEPSVSVEHVHHGAGGLGVADRPRAALIEVG